MLVGPTTGSGTQAADLSSTGAKARARNNTGNRANGRFNLEAPHRMRRRVRLTNQPFAFTFRGADYQVPPMNAWPIEALRALGAGNLDGALGELLGETHTPRWPRLGSRCATSTCCSNKIAADAGMVGFPNSPVRCCPVRPGTLKATLMATYGVDTFRPEGKPTAGARPAGTTCRRRPAAQASGGALGQTAGAAD